MQVDMATKVTQDSNIERPRKELAEAALAKAGEMLAAEQKKSAQVEAAG